MDSDSARASAESIQDASVQDSECNPISDEPQLTRTCGDSSVGEEGGEGVTGINSSVKGTDAVDTSVASELVPPEPFLPIGEGEGAVVKSVAEISDVVQGRTPVDVVSSEISPAVMEVGEGGEENAASIAQETDSMDLVGGGAVVEPSSGVVEGEEENTASIFKEGDSAAELSNSPLVGGHMDTEEANFLGLTSGKDSISEHRLEENKGVSMEEETPSHDLSVSEVNGVDSLKPQEKREESEQVACGGMADEDSSQALESELGQNTESQNEKVDVTKEETTPLADSLENIVNDIEIPDAKEVACVAGFTEISSQDKGSDDSVLNSGNKLVEEEPSKDLQFGEGAKDLSDGDAKEDIVEDAMGNQVLKEIEEQEKVDTFTALGIQTKPQEVDDVDTEVSDKNEAPVGRSSAVESQFSGETMNNEETAMDDVKEVVEKDPETGKSVDIHVSEVADEVKTDSAYDAGIEKDGDEMDGVREAGQTVDLEETRDISEEMAKADETKIAQGSEEMETVLGGEDKEKDDDMTDVPEDVKTHGDSSAADIEEGREDHEEMGVAETQEETVMGKVDGTKISELSEEKQTTIEDEDKEKDDDMADVAEDVETHGDSSIADIEEGSENHEEMETTELTDTQEESVMAETGDDEEPEEVEEESKSAGGKRKRGKNTKTVKGTGKKKEEDVCFICFDGGELVLCDRRGCPKAYHPDCVNRDEAFFRTKSKWNCGWHLCSKCEKTATYLCYTCMFSLCKGCTKDAVFFCIRGNKGLCETCMETVKLIERKEQEKEPAQLDFDDKTSWEYLFKDYWIDLKTELSLSPEELDQAKSPGKGHESHASKEGTASETEYAIDGGSDSDSSPKKRKTRSRSKAGSAEKLRSPAKKRKPSGETTEWASKELLDVVVHMRRGDRSYLPQSEVHSLLLDYIKRYNLRDPRRKSQVICDSRLQNLFGKSHVGHFEMLNLLDTHFLKKEQQQADDVQGSSVVDTDPDHVDVDENLDHPVKSSGKDKKRKTRKKGGRKGRQSNLDDFAAVDMHNINLIYLRRSLVEDLLEDTTAFEEKVASAFVRLRISGNQKQDLYRLVQVVGTSKVPEPYKVGKKTTDFVLEILNLDKTEVISIDIISNQDFTEDECKRLKQSIKCGLINRLTVGDIQEKAIALQEVRVKNLLEAEILRFSHLRDRASDMGRRKELRECVEKLQLLKSPEERQRRLEEIPEIHADPKMDPDCESEDEDEKAEKEKEKQLRSRSSSFNRRGREPISPRKGGFNSNDSWTGGTSNYSNTSGSRELSRSYSGRGSTGRGDYSDDKVTSESMWTSGREREMQQHSSSGSEKLRSVSIPETPTRSSRAAAAPLEVLSPRIASDISTAPPPPPTVPKINDSEKIWHYKDPSGKVQGPFSMAQLRKWNNTGYFPAKLEIWKAMESPLDSILLNDALAGLFQKQTQSVQVAASHSEPTARTAAPTILDIPRNSQDTWSSGGGSLPSPTPNQVTTPTAKRRSFESRWSPTKPSPQSMNHQASPVVVNSAHSFPTQDLTNVSVNHYGSAVAALPSPTPAGGKQSWGNMQTDKFDSHGPSSSVSYGTGAPNVLPSQSQPGFPPSDPWRAPVPVPVPVPSQYNTQAQVQAPASSSQWGMNNIQNSGQPQASANQNMGWVGPGQAGMNVNWAASSVPATGQGVPNPGWQGQAYPNSAWGVTGQAQTQVQVQAPGSGTGSGWMQPGQGMQSGNSNQQNWGSQNQTAIPSSGSGVNQAGYWGNQQNQNGGWNNRQTSGSGGGQNNNFKGQQRVCKFFREDGHCRKGASCNYLHN